MLVVVATLPCFAVLLSLQLELRDERRAQARAVAERQTGLIDQALTDIIAEGEDYLTAIAAIEPVATFDPQCGAALDALRHAMPNYAVLAVVREDGTAVCVSAAQKPTDEALHQMMRWPGQQVGFAIGGYAAQPDGLEPVLGLTLAMPPQAGRIGAALVAGLSLEWLGRRIVQVPHRAEASIVIADRDGIVLAAVTGAGTSLPIPGAVVGKRLPPDAEAGFSSGGAAAVIRSEFRGPASLVTYIPPSSEPSGLFVSTASDVADFDSNLAGVTIRADVLLAMATLCSLLLALLGVQRYVQAPAAVLLRAARRWGGGELGIRATMPRATSSEFTALGHAFNQMAETLQAQRTELEALNEALELRVGERTRALLESNNRLQVEIAEREMTEANLRQAQKLQAVGQLAAGVAHNFNNLLAAMLGSLELLQKRMQEVDAGQAKLLEIAKSSVARGSSLTAQLLAFSRKQPLLATPMDVAVAVAGMEALLRSTLGPEIRVVAAVDPAIWPALVDPNQFEVAILNLALNAREAMAGGGRLTITASNTIVTDAMPQSGLSAGDYVTIEVTDSGQGMPPDVAARAFEPFFTTKEAGRGAGLGLSQVHGMVSQLGGAVTIDSRPGAGTSVRMLLPRSAAVVPTVAQEPDGARAVLPPGQCVLLVDDDEQVREVTAGILEESGYTVIAAADGLAGLAALERDGARISLVIADYAMPGMTGRELLKIIRRRRPEMPLLLATGYADHMSLSGDGLPSDQIIRKPYRGSELLARIKMVVQRQASMAE